MGPFAQPAAGETTRGRPVRLLACRRRLFVGAGCWGGRKIGPNPTDRAHPGSKRHILVDASGVPVSAILTGTNAHDVTQLLPLVDATPPIRGVRGLPVQTPRFSTPIAATIPTPTVCCTRQAGRGGVGGMARQVRIPVASSPAVCDGYRNGVLHRVAKPSRHSRSRHTRDTCLPLLGSATRFNKVGIRVFQQPAPWVLVNYIRRRLR
jgi:hypothetical protein